jgi:hypothetical protein
MMPAAITGIQAICTAQIVGADGAEQHQVDDEHQAHAFPRIARVEIALDPVVGRAAPELLECFRILRFGR